MFAPRGASLESRFCSPRPLRAASSRAVRQPSSQGSLPGSCREQTSSQGGPLDLRHPFTPVSHGIEAASCREDGILTGNVSPDFAAPPLRRYRAAEVPIGVDGGSEAAILTVGSLPDVATPLCCRYRAAQVLVSAKRQPSSQGSPPEVALSTQASQAACMGWGPCCFATPTLGL